MPAAADDLFVIHQRFSASAYGRILSAQVRFEKYKPTKISNRRWEELLGPDVNNLSHLEVTYQLTKSFIRDSLKFNPKILTKKEQDLLLVSALIHDWAEAVVGDISFGDKTNSHKKLEQLEFSKNLSNFYKGNSSSQIALITQAQSEVIFNQKNKLAKMFNAIERLGYLQTALGASRLLAKESIPDCYKGLCWLTADVLGNQIVPLIKYADDFLAIKQYLLKNRAAINEAFKLVESNMPIFGKYGSSKSKKLSEFAKSNKNWLAWLSSLT